MTGVTTPSRTAEKDAPRHWEHPIVALMGDMDERGAWRCPVCCPTSVNPPEATPTTNAARPEGDDSSAREGITAR